MTTITDLFLWTTPNDDTWTPLRNGWQIINDNFDNLNNDKLETSEFTDANIKTKYENNADTNAFTDTEKTKLAWVESWSTSNSSDAFLLDRTNHTGTQSIDTITETTDKKVMTADERTQINTSRSSYVISSSVSINAWDNTKFDFSATWVIKEGNVVYPINISQTAVSPTFLATEKVTFILVDKNGNLVQQSSPATSTQIKTHLAEWVIVHSNNTNVNAVNNNSLNWDNELNQFQAYARNFWYVNLNGNRYSSNWTNLKIDKSAGRIMFPWLGQNNEKEQIAQTALSFRIRNQDGSETIDITDLDVLNYDNGWVTTAIPWATNSVWAVYRIYLFADSNITRLARPQFYYDTKEEAQLSFRNENFILEKNLDENGMLAGYILFRKNTTNLSDTDNEFISAEGSGNFGGTSFIPTLQASYNVSPQPQIITDNWSFQLQGGETDTDDVLEIKDTLGTTTATIRADGTPTKATDLVRKTELDNKNTIKTTWNTVSNLSFWVWTQAEFDAITPDSATTYLITDA